MEETTNTSQKDRHVKEQSLEREIALELLVKCKITEQAKLASGLYEYVSIDDGHNTSILKKKK